MLTVVSLLICLMQGGGEWGGALIKVPRILNFSFLQAGLLETIIPLVPPGKADNKAQDTITSPENADKTQSQY